MKKAPRGSAGVMAMACMKEEDRCNTGKPIGRASVKLNRHPVRDRPGPLGMTEGLVLPTKPGNAGGGKQPWFRVSARQSEGIGDWET